MGKGILCFLSQTDFERAFHYVCNSKCPKSILFPETWNESELEKPSSQRRDMAFYLLTETSMKDDLIVDFPNGNLILREDYKKSFKKEVRVKDLKIS